MHTVKSMIENSGDKKKREKEAYRHSYNGCGKKIGLYYNEYCIDVFTLFIANEENCKAKDNSKFYTCKNHAKGLSKKLSYAFLSSLLRLHGAKYQIAVLKKVLFTRFIRRTFLTNLNWNITFPNGDFTVH